MPASCNLCALNGARKIASQIPENGGCHVALIGEAPGAAEESLGKPFIGPSGRILNMCLYQTGVMRSAFWITNVISCRPPDNSIDSPEGFEAVSCCRGRLREELAEMRKAGIRVLVALGATATKALGLEGNLRKIRGSVYEVEGFFVIPTYHPSFILRGGSKRGEKGISHSAALSSDLKKAVEIGKNGWVKPRESFNLEPTLEDVVDFVDECLEKKLTVACDIETTGLDARRGAEVVVIGLAKSPYDAISVPILTEHGNSYWTHSEYEIVKENLERLFAAGRLVFQNCFFDIPFLKVNGWKIDVTNVDHDTIVLHSLISPETEHNLGFIVSIFGETPEWKESFKNRTMSILEMDQTEMRTYNCRDCVVLLQVLPKMLELLRSYELEEYYNEETRPLMVPFMQMTETGVGFDFAHMEAFKKHVNKILTEKDSAIREAFKIPKEFNFNSQDSLRWLLFGNIPSTFKKLSSVRITYTKQLKKGTKVAEKIIWGQTKKTLLKSEIPENTLTIDDVATLDYKRPGTKDYEELLGLKAIADIKPLYMLKNFRGIKTSSQKIAVSRDGKLSYRIALQNRLQALEGLKTPKIEEQEQIEDVLVLLGLLADYSEFAKLATSFTNYKPHDDGRIRPSWAMSGTATGRLTVKSPNLAQLPARGDGADVRKFFVASPGNSIIAADYENAEVALLGYETFDETIIRIYTEGRNIHDENTGILFKLKPTDALWSEGRKAAKVFQFGGLSYGGGDREIYRKILMAAPHLPLTMKDFVAAKEAWMETHPAYVDWKQRITDEVSTKRKLYNAFGRMRIFLGHPRDIIKEGMNFMIQSAGACVVNRTMIRLARRFAEEHLNAKFILQVYDELVLEAPDPQAERAAFLLKEEMQRPFMMHGVQRMLRAEVGIGKTYGDAK